MFKTSITIILLMIALSTSCADNHRDITIPDKVFTRYSTNLSFHSSILNKSIKYAIYLPASYVKDKDKKYDVVYLLHGLGNDHNDWNDQYLNVTSLINDKESKGYILEMIYVMPQGFDSYYVNTYDGKFNYMDMFIKELIPFIDETYQTKANRNNRAIVGYSMGGYGAMILGSKHPDHFSISVPLSMSFRTDDQYMQEPSNGWNNQWGKIFGGVGLQGKERLTDYYKKHSPFYYFNPQTSMGFSNMNYFIDCGDDEEQLLIGNDLLHVQMRDLGIDHEYRVSDGGHTSSYWRKSMEEVLSYISCKLKGEIYSKEDVVETEESFYGVMVTDVIEGIETVVFKSGGYDDSLDNTAIYFVHDNWSSTDIIKAINLLDISNDKKSFVVLSIDNSLLDRGLSYFAKSVKQKYSVSENIGIGIGHGGNILYDSSVSQSPKFSSLFLFDSFLGEEVKTPNRGTFYYIDITDMGTNYKSAGELYTLCKQNNVMYEYRVRNGVDSKNSHMQGVSLAKQFILSRIKGK